MLKLSFIIPLYNTEQFIIECLESLYNQYLSESEYEVIVIDDGSTDLGPVRVLDFAKTKTNCYLFTQSNIGPAAARNNGLRKARGEFVMFVDADDYLFPDTIRYFLTRIEENELDLIRGKIADVGYDGHLLSVSSSEKYSERVMDGVQLCTEVIQGEYYSVLYLIRKSVLSHHQLFFPENIYLCEDLCFLIHLCSLPVRTMALNRVLYAYRRNNPTSIVATAASLSKLMGYIWVLTDIQQIDNFRMKAVVNKAVSKGVCMILYWAASLSKPEKEQIIQALAVPAFSHLCLCGSLRFRIQALIYNLFSARGFLLFKQWMDAICLR